MQCFTALCYGSAAETALKANHGILPAVFEHSFYLQTQYGLVCFGPVIMGAGPLNVLCDFPTHANWQQTLASVTKQIVVCNNNKITILDAPSFSITLNQVKRWSPEPIHPYQKPQLAQGLKLLCHAVEKTTTTGLGCLIAYFCSADNKPCDKRLQSIIDPCAQLFHWLIANIEHREPCLPSALFGALLGRGPGLTPSGDDFIGAILITLQVLGYQHLQQPLKKLILPRAKTHTNLISYHQLLCAGNGQGAAMLHKTIADICTGGRNITSHLRAIDAIGHSSGWDALAGVTAVCVAIVNSGSQTR